MSGSRLAMLRDPRFKDMLKRYMELSQTLKMYQRIYQNGLPLAIRRSLQQPIAVNGSEKPRLGAAQGEDNLVLQHRAMHIPTDAIAVKIRRRLRYKLKK